MARLILTAVIFVACSLPMAALACMHPGGIDFHEVTLEQSDQTVLIVFHEGRQELILKGGYDSDEELPSLGWFIPLPTIPQRY